MTEAGLDSFQDCYQTCAQLGKR